MVKKAVKEMDKPSCEGVGELLELVRLQNTGRKKARDFSLGMRQRLGLLFRMEWGDYSMAW